MPDYFLGRVAVEPLGGLVPEVVMTPSSVSLKMASSDESTIEVMSSDSAAGLLSGESPAGIVMGTLLPRTSTGQAGWHRVAHVPAPRGGSHGSAFS